MEKTQISEREREKKRKTDRQNVTLYESHVFSRHLT